MDDRPPLHRTPLLRLAGLLWPTYLASETIAAAAFPGYSYARNYISDLGVAAARVIDGRSVHSPLALVMNLGLLCDGALFVVASFVGAIALRAQRCRSAGRCRCWASPTGWGRCWLARCSMAARRRGRSRRCMLSGRVFPSWPATSA